MRPFAHMIGGAVIAATLVAWSPAADSPPTDAPGDVCQLPVSTGTDLGFLGYPSGRFTADPHAKPALPGSQGSSVANFGYAFDSALKQWVPVTSNLVSPDGTKYVYGDLQVVDIATGTEGQPTATSAHTWHPIAWEPEGIYAVTIDAQGAQPGLWLVPFPGGEPREIIADGLWEAARNGAAYGFVDTVVPTDHSTAINRLDVKSGAVTKWFYLAGSRLPYIAGFDASGAPVIQQSVQVFVVPAAMQPVVVTDNTHASSAIGDQLGIWVGNSAGMFLFAGGNFTQVTKMPASPAGVCLGGTTTVSPPAEAPGPASYTVRPGDTLSGVARAFGLSSYLPFFWRNEWRLEPGGGMLTDPNLIRPGWVLEIPSEPLPVYVVRGGDSLGSIAEKFYGPGQGARWHGIYDANRDQVRDPALIYPGQTLRIP